MKMKHYTLVGCILLTGMNSLNNGITKLTTKWLANEKTNRHIMTLIVTVVDRESSVCYSELNIITLSLVSVYINELTTNDYAK